MQLFELQQIQINHQSNSIQHFWSTIRILKHDSTNKARVPALPTIIPFWRHWGLPWTLPWVLIIKFWRNSFKHLQTNDKSFCYLKMKMKSANIVVVQFCITSVSSSKSLKMSILVEAVCD